MAMTDRHFSRHDPRWWGRKDIGAADQTRTENGCENMTNSIAAPWLRGTTYSVAAALILAGCSDSSGATDPVSSIKVSGSTNNQVAAAGTMLPTSPEVALLRASGEKAVGETVTFAITSGGGTLTNPVVVTDSRGVVRVGGWTLGQTAGANTMTATTVNNLSVTFKATGIAGPATNLQVLAGNEQTAPAGTTLPVDPVLSANDQFGNGVPGVSVRWEIGLGGGSVPGSGTGTTKPDGSITIPAWILGPAPGPNTLLAIATLSQATDTITLTATATP